MKDLNKNIEEFASALGAFESVPSDMVWNQLETKLNSPSSPQSNRNGLISGGIFTVALFCLLLVMEGSIFYLSSEQIRRDNLLLFKDFEKEEFQVKNPHNQLIELIKEKNTSPNLSEIEIVKAQENLIKPAKENSIIKLIEAEEFNIQSTNLSPTSDASKIGEESKKEEEIIQEKKKEKILSKPAVEAYKNRLRANSSKKKKKFRMGLQLPSFRHKPWRRGKNWDYQVGIEGGIRVQSFTKGGLPSFKLGINGEFALSPYFRLSIGAAFNRQYNWDYIGSFLDFDQKTLFLDRRYITLDPNNVMNNYRANIKMNSIDIPISAKFFLPLRKKRIEPYIGIGASIQTYIFAKEITSLALIDNQTFVSLEYFRQPQVDIQLNIKGGAEFKISKRVNLQLGLAYQGANVMNNAFYLETSLWFTGNRGYFRWRKEY